MSRPSANFQLIFEEMGMACGQFTPSDISSNAVLQVELLNCFHRAYAKGYNERAWEDAWEGATITPTNRLVTYSQIGEARKFEVWTKDPRDPDNAAQPVRYVTAASGITLLTDEATVYVLSLPPAPRFQYTLWVTATTYAVGDLRRFTDGHVYKCLVAHTSGTFATDLAAAKWVILPCLATLHEFIIEYGAGCYDLNKGNYATGGARRKDALQNLERIAQDEHFRSATNLWQPR